LEWLKIAAWVFFQRPFSVRQGSREVPPGYDLLVIILSAVVVVYGQFSALISAYVINDDVCQHIWWMRTFRDPGLFPQDFLLEYARSLQNFGILGLYWCVSFVMDPVVFTKVLVLILFPLSAWVLFRFVLAWTKDAFAALLTAAVWMVTPVYMQHMTGGHAHVFGYPLMILFLYAYMVQKYYMAAGVLIAAAGAMARFAVFYDRCMCRAWCSCL